MPYAVCRLPPPVDNLAAPDAAASASVAVVGAAAVDVNVAVAIAGILAASCDCNFCAVLANYVVVAIAGPQIYVACFHLESVKCALDFADSTAAAGSGSVSA